MKLNIVIMTGGLRIRILSKNQPKRVAKAFWILKYFLSVSGGKDTLYKNINNIVVIAGNTWILVMYTCVTRGFQNIP